MHQLPITQQILLILQGLALLVLCLRLWRAGLHRVYVFFFIYLVLELLQTFIPVIVPIHNPLYVPAFALTEATIVCFYTLVVLELYSVILRDLAGLASTARRYIKIALGLSILLSLLPLTLEKGPVTVTAYLFDFERPIISSLAVFIFLLAAFLVYYPVPLHRNVIFYLTGYAVMFLAHAVTIFFANLGHYWTQQYGTVLMATTDSCLVFWMIALDQRGEIKTVVVGHQWNAADEARLLRQLEAINKSLLRAARK